MAERDSERLIRTFTEDELARQNVEDIQGAGNGSSKPRRQRTAKPSLPMYRPARASSNPFRCSTCGNSQLRAFATMYAQGTSTAVSMKGFIFKHGYQKTWRQTEMAKMCAPPRKKNFWPALLLLVAASVGTFAVLSDFMSTTVNNRVMVGSFLLGWLGIYMLAYHFYWNLRHYPQRMEAYARMHFCPRCGTVTKV
jgi:hypothetical protein